MVRTNRCEPYSSPSAFGATEIAQMSLPRRLCTRGFREAAALACRRRARNQALHGLAGAGRTSGCVGKTDQQLDNLVTFSAMETKKRHSRFSHTADRTPPVVQVLRSRRWCLSLGYCPLRRIRPLHGAVQEPDQSEPFLAAHRCGGVSSMLAPGNHDRDFKAHSDTRGAGAPLFDGRFLRRRRALSRT
jgi:hypothetical protein